MAAVGPFVGRVFRPGIIVVFLLASSLAHAQQIPGQSSRAASIQGIVRAERRYNLAFAAAVGIEALMFAAYLALADLSNRTHVLLLIATVATYTILALGLVALGAHVNKNTLRILRAVQLAAQGQRPS